MTAWPSLATLACTALVLAACGGGTEASWCLSGNDGGWSAGYNSSDCPPEHKTDAPPVQPEGTQALPNAAVAVAQP